jgi:hypothetical protein
VGSISLSRACFVQKSGCKCGTEVQVWGRVPGNFEASGVAVRGNCTSDG